MRWLVVVGSYTLAGAVSSVAVGAGFGAFGGVVWKEVIPPALAGVIGSALVAVVGSGALARELGMLPVGLPQARRQTGGVWAKSYGLSAAAVLWGFDLGLLFTTWLTFSGAWLVVTLAFVLGSPALGAALLVSYWLGRALSVWMAPLFLIRLGGVVQLLDEITRERPLFRRLHVVALVPLTMLGILLQADLAGG